MAKRKQMTQEELEKLPRPKYRGWPIDSDPDELDALAKWAIGKGIAECSSVEAYVLDEIWKGLSPLHRRFAMLSIKDHPTQ